MYRTRPASCVGAPAAFGGTIAGVNCGPGGSNGFQGVAFDGQTFTLGTFTTQELPVITLLSIVPIPAAVPEPGTAGLLAIGFLLTALSRMRWRPRSAPAAISRGGIRRLP